MLKKIQFRIEFLIVFLKKKFPYVFIALAVSISIFVFREKLIKLYQTPSFYTHIIGIEGQYSQNNLPNYIQEKISYGLVQLSENNKPIDSPIAKLEDVQNNNKDYIFNIDNNFTWHNGKKLTSSDINYNIPGIIITPITPQQLKISLENQFSPVLSILSTPIFKKDLVGVGPYKVRKITYQDGHIKQLFLYPTNRDSKKIVYKFYQNENDLITAYKLGQIDEFEISYLPDEITDYPKTKINKDIETNSKYSAIFFNIEKINNRQLRQALAYATEKPIDKNERALGPISPNSWAYNPNVKEYPYSQKRAKELFDKNKIETLSLAVFDRRLLSTAESIKAKWKEILDIEVTISIETQLSSDFDAILTYASIPNDPDQYTFWHSTQTKTNITKLTDSRIDKLLEEGRQTYDSQERKKIYFDFQKFLLEESPAIFLSYPTKYHITRVK